MAKEHLANYLNDHMAGAVSALELLEQLGRENQPPLGELKRDIEEDRRELKALMQRLGIAESRIRKVGGWLTEKLAEFKLNVDDPSDGSLRRFESLEALAIGIEGKRALWSALRAASKFSRDLQGLDYPRLIQRAEQQRDLVEVLRLNAAKWALA